MNDMHYVQELVNVFKHLFEGLEVQLVWFIKKRRRGDGFQRWHQDLVANATTAATIVVNIDFILAGDELYQIEQIRESHRLMEEVSVNTSSNNENESEPGEDRAPNKAASGECIKVNCSAFQFSAAVKAPRLGSVEESQQKKAFESGRCDDQERDTI